MPAHQDYLTEETPPRATLVGWLKLNLALTMFVISIVSGIGGAVVTATWQIADARHDVEDIMRTNTRIAGEVAKLQLDLTGQTTTIFEMRRTRDIEVATLRDRVAVLEAQVQFFAVRLLPVKQGSH